MTEDQAKTKWCPMVRMTGDRPEEQPANRWHNYRDTPDFTACIASDCMMWRVIDEHLTINTIHPQYCTTGHCLPGCKYGQGYCGIAGRAGAL